ncbi:MAG: UvrD-helicase domain-containing protein [Phycisphaerae bacterium]
MTVSPNTTWTPEQARVIAHTTGNILVSAAAGAGKTAVLTERCIRLLTHEDENVRTNVDRLLVLTFTEAAAGEMAQRIGQKLEGALSDERLGGLQRSALREQLICLGQAHISTIHSFCGWILRNYYAQIGLDPTYKIIEQQEYQLLEQEVLDTLCADVLATAEHPNYPAFTRALEVLADFDLEKLRGYIQQAANVRSSIPDPEGWAKDSLARFTPDGAQACILAAAKVLAREILLVLEVATQNEVITRQHGATKAADTLAGFAQEWGEYARALDEAATRSDWSALNQAWDTLQANKLLPWSRWSTQKNICQDLKEYLWDDVKELINKGIVPRWLQQAKADITLDAYAHQLLQQHEVVQAFLELVTLYETRMEAQKVQRNVRYFNDLERLAYKLLQNPDVQKSLRSKYDYVLIDEFQDTSPLQEAILRAVARDETDRGNLFIVGDIKQSIYAFRAAEPQLFLDYQQRWQQSAHAGSTATLPHNFRSQPRLLEGMNQLFGRLMAPDTCGIDYRNGHAFAYLPPAGTGADDPKLLTGVPIELHIYCPKTAAQQGDIQEDDTTEDELADDLTATRADAQEANLIAELIQQLIAQQPLIKLKSAPPRKLEYRDIVILLRSAKTKASDIKKILEKHGIPVHAHEGQGYYNTLEIRQVIALLQVLDHTDQDVPLMGALISPFGRFTYTELAQLNLEARTAEYPSLYSRLSTYRQQGANLELRGRLENFFADIERFRTWIRTLPLHEALTAILRDSNFLLWQKGLPDGSSRQANLEKLIDIARKYSNFKQQGLSRLLVFIDKLKKLEMEEGEASVLSEAENVVRIMTIHKSKGLEFPVVIVAQCNKQRNTKYPEVRISREYGVAPLFAAADNTWQATILTKLHDAQQNLCDLQEELRVFYVAATRASHKLIFTAKYATLSETKGKYIDKLEPLRAYYQQFPDPIPLALYDDSQPIINSLIYALSKSEYNTQWSSVAKAGTDANFTVSIHPQSPTMVSDVTAFQEYSLPAEAIPTPIELSEIFARLDYVYPHLAHTLEPAMATVSTLKSMIASDPDADTVTTPAGPKIDISYPYEYRQQAQRLEREPDGVTERGELPAVIDARQRGTATHRILECLRFANLQTASTSAYEAEVGDLLRLGKISPNDHELADHAGIRWFLQQEIAQALYSINRSLPLLTHPGPQLYRELPFSLPLPPEAQPDSVPEENPSPLDCLTVRGVIDAVVIQPEGAVIMDYKTDQPHLVDQHLPIYQQQLRYYARAIEQIAGIPVTQAHLIFLTARRIETLAGEALHQGL